MSQLNETFGMPTSPLPQSQSGVAINSPQAMAEDEISRYMQVPRSACVYSNAHQWWGNPAQIKAFPCLSQVASALFGMKPGSGGLECDIGGMSDVISRRRGSLGPGMVEASMMIKLNKDRIVRDPTLVEELPKTWKDFIPKRPTDPADYYSEPEQEDADDEEDNPDGGPDPFSDDDEESLI
jgi:hypothetical protein